jgi:hypothetical protein
MRFAITSSSFILGQLINGTPQTPAIIELPDDTDTDHLSRAWSPLDEAAVAGLKRLDADAIEFRKNGRPGAGPVVVAGKRVVVPAPAGAAVVPVRGDEGAVQVSPVRKATAGAVTVLGK